jgi:hypothetical protein
MDTAGEVIASMLIDIDGTKTFSFSKQDLANGGLSGFNGHLTLQATVVETATQETQVGSFF